MNWISNFVRPKIKSILQTRDVADNMWEKCPSCGQMIFHRDLNENLRVCPHCSHHFRLGADARLNITFDSGKYTYKDTPDVKVDRLKFKDLKRYTERLKAAQSSTRQKDAVRVAMGKIGGHRSTVAIFDFDFMGGSMGTAAGEAIVRAADIAREERTPLIIFVSSGGARMQEGILSLMQMPRTIIAVERLKEEKLPFIVVLTDPTTGGVSASFAMVGDVHIAEPRAVIGFAGRRVIEQTVREHLPDDFQTAEYLLEHGMVDMVVKRADIRDAIIRLLGVFAGRRRRAA